MKKHLLPFLLVYLFMNTTGVYASFIIGSTFPGQIVSDIISLATGASTFIDTSANVEVMLKETILDPIANQLISSVIEQSSDNITSWVTGGFDGAPSLITADPQDFIQKAGLRAAKGALGNIPEDSVFGDSLFATLKDTYSGANDLKAQIEGLSKSDIPTLLQDKICSDAALTALAINDVKDKDTGAYTNSEVTARKTSLYNYACAGDPNTDPQVARRLDDLNTQNPNLTGLDGWYKLTVEGQNAYTRGAIAKDLVVKKAEADKDLATKENFGGGQNAVSEKECEVYEEVTRTTDPNDAVGKTEDQKCLKWRTITPGATVGALFAKGQSVGLERLTNIMGDGSLSGLLSGLAVAFTNNGNKNRGAGPKASNMSVTVSSSRPVRQDLLNDPSRKEETMGTMMKQFTAYEETLNNLEGVDNSILADINTYQNKVTTGKTCYDELVKEDPSKANDGRVINAYSFYANRQSKINVKKNSLVPEITKIARAKSLNQQTLTALNESNSTQEMSTIFRTYQTALNSESLPKLGSEATRTGEGREIKNQTENDKDLDTNNNTCIQMQGSRTTGTTDTTGYVGGGGQ